MEEIQNSEFIEILNDTAKKAMNQEVIKDWEVKLTFQGKVTSINLNADTYETLLKLIKESNL